MKKKRTLLLSALLLLSMVLTACGGSAGGSASGGSWNGSVMSDAGTGNPGPGSDPGIWMENESFPESADSSVYADPDAKVIRTAELTIQTTEFDQSVSALAALTEQVGGYYENASVDGGGYYDRYANRTASYVVRVPKENYNTFRNKMGEVGHLYRISEETDDVGEVYYDTEARLATLKTKQDRLLALLEKADLMEDIISLENALSDVQYEIELHSTTLRKYDSLIDYATFHIYLEEVVKISTEPTPEDSFLTKLGASFGRGAEGFVSGLGNLILWLARNIIGLVILAIVVVVVVKIVLRLKKRRSSPPEDQ